jgi:hypothetical protein
MKRWALINHVYFLLLSPARFTAWTCPRQATFCHLYTRIITFIIITLKKEKLASEVVLWIPEWHLKCNILFSCTQMLSVSIRTLILSYESAEVTYF